MDEQEKQINVEEIQKKMSEILNMNEIENLIKSNEVEFDIEETKYRVKKPTFAQKQEAYKKRIEKFTELLKDDKYILEADLKATYLKRGVDIDEISKKMREKTTLRDNLMFDLGKAIKEQQADNELKSYKEQIDSLQYEINMLSIKRTQLLELSIENQVMIYTYSYLTFLTTEKKEVDNWVRVWNKYEEFLNDSGVVANRAAYYVAMLTSVDEV